MSDFDETTFADGDYQYIIQNLSSKVDHHDSEIRALRDEFYALKQGEEKAFNECMRKINGGSIPNSVLINRDSIQVQHSINFDGFYNFMCAIYLGVISIVLLIKK